MWRLGAPRPANHDFARFDWAEVSVLVVQRTEYEHLRIRGCRLKEHSSMKGFSCSQMYIGETNKFQLSRTTHCERLPRTQHSWWSGNTKDYGKMAFIYKGLYCQPCPELSDKKPMEIFVYSATWSNRAAPKSDLALTIDLVKKGGRSTDWRDFLTPDVTVYGNETYDKWKVYWRPTSVSSSITKRIRGVRRVGHSTDE